MDHSALLEQSLVKMAGKFVYQEGSPRPIHFMPMLENVLLQTPELVALLSIKMATAGYIDRQNKKVQAMLDCFLDHNSYQAACVSQHINSQLGIDYITEIYPGIGIFWEYYQYCSHSKQLCEYIIYGTEHQQNICLGLHSLKKEHIFALKNKEDLSAHARESLCVYNQMSAFFYGATTHLSLEEFLLLSTKAKCIIMPIFFGNAPQEITSIRGHCHKVYTAEQVKHLLDDRWQVHFAPPSGQEIFLPLADGNPAQYVICTAYNAAGVTAEDFAVSTSVHWPEVTHTMPPMRYSFLENTQVTLCDDTTSHLQNQLVRMHSEVKFLFLNATGHIHHEYPISTNRDMDNLAGYVDKLFKYRDTALVAHLFANGLSSSSMREAPFPLLQTRSPQLDWVLQKIITTLYETRQRKVTVFELGCTVCEHLDMLDLMIRVESKNSLNAQKVLTFFGLDISAQILDAAKTLHPSCDESTLRLICAEGGDVANRHDSYDLSFTVGVANHIHTPVQALTALLRQTGTAFLGVIWITHREEGFWTIVHSGRHNYFFSLQDFQKIQMEVGGFFSILTYTPEEQTTQHSSYIGLSKLEEDQIGSVLLVWTRGNVCAVNGAHLLPGGREFSKEYLDALPRSVYTRNM